MNGRRPADLHLLDSCNILYGNKHFQSQGVGFGQLSLWVTKARTRQADPREETSVRRSVTTIGRPRALHNHASKIRFATCLLPTRMQIERQIEKEKRKRKKLMNQPPHDQSPLLIPIPGQAGQDDAVVVIATMYTSKFRCVKRKPSPSFAQP